MICVGVAFEVEDYYADGAKWMIVLMRGGQILSRKVGILRYTAWVMGEPWPVPLISPMCLVIGIGLANILCTNAITKRNT